MLGEGSRRPVAARRVGRSGGSGPGSMWMRRRLDRAVRRGVVARSGFEHAAPVSAIRPELAAPASAIRPEHA
jgi:hypothetical protein